jgi:hypothetical protein
MANFGDDTIKQVPQASDEGCKEVFNFIEEGVREAFPNLTDCNPSNFTLVDCQWLDYDEGDGDEGHEGLSGLWYFAKVNVGPCVGSPGYVDSYGFAWFTIIRKASEDVPATLETERLEVFMEDSPLVSFRRPGKQPSPEDEAATSVTSDISTSATQTTTTSESSASESETIFHNFHPLGSAGSTSNLADIRNATDNNLLGRGNPWATSCVEERGRCTSFKNECCDPWQIGLAACGCVWGRCRCIRNKGGIR